MSLCANCHGGCCRSFAVPVTGADILRIMGRYGLDFWDFVVRWADPEGMIARKHAPQFRFQDEPETPFVICLKQDASRCFPGTSKCQFLQESPPTAEHPLGLAQCGLYEHRPSACRAFPAKLNATHDLAILYDVPAVGRPGDHPAYQLCPRQWTLADIDPVQQVQDLVVAKYEMDYFHLLAQSWNRQPARWELFPEFLRLVYADRMQSAQEGPEPQAVAETVSFPRIAA